MHTHKFINSYICRQPPCPCTPPSHAWNILINQHARLASEWTSSKYLKREATITNKKQKQHSIHTHIYSRYRLQISWKWNEQNACGWRFANYFRFATTHTHSHLCIYSCIYPSVCLSVSDVFPFVCLSALTSIATQFCLHFNRIEP